MDNPQWWIWSIWSQLSVLYHLFFSILLAVTAYCLFSATTMIRIRSDGLSAQRSATLRIRSTNMNRTIGTMYWVFGVVFFWGLQDAPRGLGHGGTALVGIQILGNFTLHFAFAENVFLVFLVLHLVHWFVESRLNSGTSVI